eukprot:g3019.t1
MSTVHVPALSPYYRTQNLSNSVLTAVDCCYERQRYYPIAGWSSALLPTDPEPWSSQRNAFKYKDKECFEDALPHGWQWASPWSLFLDRTKADLEGWSYETSFDGQAWTREPSFAGLVRRRLWQRIRFVVVNTQYSPDGTGHIRISTQSTQELERVAMTDFEVNLSIATTAAHHGVAFNLSSPVGMDDIVVGKSLFRNSPTESAVVGTEDLDELEEEDVDGLHDVDVTDVDINISRDAPRAGRNSMSMDDMFEEVSLRTPIHFPSRSRTYS